ncbi:MAG: type II toxin-antitoxin system YoeB family toxin [Bacteroidales bacterium]|nr:type II toxin-antitoxin system YoeB family toxin [Bacteroidales bacterium]
MSFIGKGKPESLKFDLTGLLSRIIDLEHRMVCSVGKSEIYIYS